MGLKTLLTAVSPRQKERPIYFSMASLTFSVTNDKPTSVLEVDSTKFRSIGTNGHGIMYSIASEPVSIEEADMMRMAKARLIDAIIERKALNWDKSELSSFSQKAAEKFLGQKLSSDKTKVLAYMVTHDTVGYGPISVLLDDSGDIEEIEMNAPMSNIVIYHRRYGRCTTNMRFNSEADFMYTINRMAAPSGKELGQVNQVIDAQLGQCRLHAQARPYAISGGSASIRINHGITLGMRELLLNKTITPSALAYLWMAVEAGKNIIISGAPGSGKTTMLTAISSFLPRDLRIVTIEEEINEICLDRGLSHLVQLRSSSPGMGIGDQVRNALHMRPEMLVIGEIRGSEANDVFSGANIGVPFMTTMHSDGDGNALLARLYSKPMHLEDSLIRRLDITLFMRRNPDGSRKLESMSEYLWADEPGQRPLSISSIAVSSLVDEDAVKGSILVMGSRAAFNEFKRRGEHLSKLMSDGMAVDPAVHIRDYR